MYYFSNDPKTFSPAYAIEKNELIAFLKAFLPNEVYTNFESKAEFIEDMLSAALLGEFTCVTLVTGVRFVILYY